MAEIALPLISILHMPRIGAQTAIVVPPAWDKLNGHIVLWHGSVQSAALDIQVNGIALTRSRTDLDFGRGF